MIVKVNLYAARTVRLFLEIRFHKLRRFFRRLIQRVVLQWRVRCRYFFLRFLLCNNDWISFLRLFYLNAELCLKIPSLPDSLIWWYILFHCILRHSIRYFRIFFLTYFHLSIGWFDDLLCQWKVRYDSQEINHKNRKEHFPRQSLGRLLFCLTIDLKF